jgi:hypothetical protein
VLSTSSSLHLLSLHLLLLAATIEATTFSVINQCSYTVWPAAVPVGGGMQLDPGKVWPINVPAGTTGGRIWARTGCTFDGKGNGSCQTGDCDGLLACKGYSQPPNTLAEFTIGQGQQKIPSTYPSSTDSTCPWNSCQRWFKEGQCARGHVVQPTSHRSVRAS